MVFYNICGIGIEGMAIETETSVEETWFQKVRVVLYVLDAQSQNPITQIKQS